MVVIRRQIILEKYIEQKYENTFEDIVHAVISEHQKEFKHNKILTSNDIKLLKNKFKDRWKKAHKMKDRF